MQLQYNLFDHLCECGCGNPTNLAPNTSTRFGWIKGQPLRFIRGHNGRLPLEQRFWAKVDKTADCWLWTGAISRSGYGVIGKDSSTRALPAHRVSWELHFGSIPEGLYVCHRCDVKRCIRDSHLFLGTNQDNMDDAASKGILPQGSANGNSKLVESDILLIRQRYDTEHISPYQLGREFKVHPSTIYQVIHHKTWKHI